MPAKKNPGKGFDSILAGARPLTKTVRVLFDCELLAEIDRLNETLTRVKFEDANENRPPRAPGIATEILDLEARARDAEVEFTFRNVGRKAWSDLVAANPPRDVDKKAGRDYNGETFPVAAMAAACIEPEDATVEGFQQIADSDLVTQSQWDKLFTACLLANAGSTDVPFSVAAHAIAQRTGLNSGPREAMASLEASSSAA